MKLSVIIPTINEAKNICGAVESSWSAGASEVIVVDGGSTDRTRENAEAARCKWIESEPGRGTQLATGAAEAKGDVFLFLHADARLTGNVAKPIQAAVDAGFIGGCFEQRIDAVGFSYRAIEFGNSLRARFQKLIYGDQGLFVTREAYSQAGGFETVPLMEDFMFSQRLKSVGQTTILPGPIKIQARRWIESGPLRQTIKNWTIAIRFRLGATPESLSKLYRRHDSE